MNVLCVWCVCVCEGGGGCCKRLIGSMGDFVYITCSSVELEQEI